jgi:copper homeostasis protein
MSSERGGAQRVELCSNLAEGGVTPSAGLIAMVRKRVAIATHVLIRPRAGDFCYSADEFEVMKRDIVLAKQLGANGVVLGILDERKRVDIARTRDLVELARPLSVTFNRAIDESSDMLTALEDVVRSGANRILTSGGAPTADAGGGMIADLVKASAGRIGIIACGTIREHNVAEIVTSTGVHEVHARLQTCITEREGTRIEVQAATVSSFLNAASKAITI